LYRPEVISPRNASLCPAQCALHTWEERALHLAFSTLAHNKNNPVFLWKPRACILFVRRGAARTHCRIMQRAALGLPFNRRRGAHPLRQRHIIQMVLLLE